MHADAYSSKLPAFMRQRLKHVGNTLAQERGGGTAGGRKHEFGRTAVGDGDMCRQGWRQYPLDALFQCVFALLAFE